MSCYSPLWDLTFIDLTGELTGSWYCRQQVETKTDDWTVYIKTDHQSYFSSPSPVSSLWGGQYQTRVLWSKSKNVSSLLFQVQVTSWMTENNSLSSVPYHLVNMTRPLLLLQYFVCMRCVHCRSKNRSTFMASIPEHNIAVTLQYNEVFLWWIF